MMHSEIVIICLGRSSAYISVDKEVHVLKQKFSYVLFLFQVKTIKC